MVSCDSYLLNHQRVPRETTPNITSQHHAAQHSQGCPFIPSLPRNQQTCRCLDLESALPVGHRLHQLIGIYQSSTKKRVENRLKLNYSPIFMDWVCSNFRATFVIQTLFHHPAPSKITFAKWCSVFFFSLPFHFSLFPRNLKTALTHSFPGIFTVLPTHPLFPRNVKRFRPISTYFDQLPTRTSCPSSPFPWPSWNHPHYWLIPLVDLPPCPWAWPGTENPKRRGAQNQAFKF